MNLKGLLYSMPSIGLWKVCFLVFFGMVCVVHVYVSRVCKMGILLTLYLCTCLCIEWMQSDLFYMLLTCGVLYVGMESNEILGMHQDIENLKMG